MSRKILVGAFGLAAITLVAGCAVVKRHPVGNSAVPAPAKPVELSKYLGKWYELARYEQFFQRGCDGVTAEYTLNADNSIRVVNRCRRPNGKLDDAVGKAKVVDQATNAKLKVSFFGPIYGDYWVLDHADDYSWAIVGEGSGRYLWLLHRQPTPGNAVLDAMIARAAALGYDTAMLRITKQP